MIPSSGIGIVIIVVIAAIYYTVRSIKRRMQKEKVAKPTKAVTKGKTLHRCPNPECQALFETPVKETVYITTPPTVKSKCPECGEVLETLTEGVCSIGLRKFETPKVVSSNIVKPGVEKVE